MRARNLKPGFFKNADLAELAFEARILFQGLWCLADRRGRLEDRPKQIGGEVLPYDHLDIPPLLDSLQKQGLILRYTKHEKQYIQINNFEKHQHPHVREPESTIPAPDKVVPGTSPARLTPDSPLLTPESNNNDTPVALPPKAEAATPVPPSDIDPDKLIRGLAYQKGIRPPPTTPKPNVSPQAQKPKPYKPPETPLAKFLIGIKILQGYPADDRAWDSVYFARYAKAAKDMLKFFNDDWEAALEAAEGMVKDFKAKGLSWTVETLVRNAPARRLQHERS